MIFCNDTTMKYNGCHFEHTAATTFHARLESSFTRQAAVAPNASVTATNNVVIVWRRTLLPERTSCPSMHSERNKRLRTATRQAQQMTVIADAANVQCSSHMIEGANGWTASKLAGLRRRVAEVCAV